MGIPKPLKAAQTSFHHGLDTIEQTKAIRRTPLVKLTLDEAKTACTKERTAAEKKCKADKLQTHYECLQEGVTTDKCDEKKMNDAAACEVSHKTAYNKCFSLWTRAKKNVHEAQKKAAAPMQHSDLQVNNMEEGAKKCATLQTKAHSKCVATSKKYTSA